MSGRLLLFFAAGTLLMAWVMTTTGKPLRTTSTPYAIVSLELASDKTKVDSVLQTWRAINTRHGNAIETAKQNTYFDFIFLLFYAPFLFGCCKKLVASSVSERLAQLGPWIARGALLAGLLDVFENLGMLQSLNGNITDTIACLTATAAYAKFLLLIIAVLFILYMLFRKLLNRIK